MDREKVIELAKAFADNREDKDGSIGSVYAMMADFALSDPAVELAYEAGQRAERERLAKAEAELRAARVVIRHYASPKVWESISPFDDSDFYMDGGNGYDKAAEFLKQYPGDDAD